MQANPFNVSQEQASEALKKYREHRSVYDQRDWEIERIYRAISRGKTIISVRDAIRNAGLDELGRPKLAITRADEQTVGCNVQRITPPTYRFYSQRGARWHFDINFETPARGWWSGQARVPRIPPQYRPPAKSLKSYHILFEAEWKPTPPRDPFLLKRLSEDAWIVLAAWELTDVEVSVMRNHPRQ